MIRVPHRFAVRALSPALLMAGLATYPGQLHAKSPPAPLSAVALPLRMFPEDRTNHDERLTLAIPPPMKSRETTLTKLLSEVTAFDQPPVSTSGFSHIVVPFDTDERTNSESVNEAYAFSLLLQSAIRWSDGCYQTMDPLTFFRTDKKLLMLTSRTLNRDGVKRVAKDATATHVITGTLKRTDKKYTAEVDIFDKNAVPQFKRKYKEPLGYFELLARVSADIAEFMGHPITDAAQTHIQQQRCQYRRSLIDLGSLVYEDDRHTELRVFTDILERDPGFAEVRVYAATQGHLIRGDKAGFARHVRQAFTDYMTPEALDAFLTTDGDALRPSLTDVDRTMLITMLGPENPLVLTANLMGAPPPLETIRIATRVSAMHPCDAYLLETLASAVSVPSNSVVDLDLASELLWTSLQCRADSPGTNGTYRITRNLARHMLDVGNADFAARIMDSIFTDVNSKDGYSPTTQDVYTYYESLRQNRRYEDAFNAAMMGVLLNKNSTQEAQTDFVVDAGFAAALAGDRDMIQQVLTKFRRAFDSRKVEAVLLGEYVKVLKNGEHADEPATNLPPSISSQKERLLLQAQYDLLTSQQRHRGEVEIMLQKFPMDRELWSLFDSYDRQQASTNSVYFYESLNWLAGTDPWAVRAVSDFRDRTRKLTLATVSDADWDAALLPGSAVPLPPVQALAASLQPLLLKKKFDQAELRIRMYMDRLPTEIDDSNHPGSTFSLRVYCQHLLRLTQCHVLFPGT